MDLTGKACGAYEVWGPIGEGGMSRVFLARHRELSTPAIFKTLLGAESDAYARLRNEARLTARISSPRVVRAVDVGIHEGTPYLVEEYVDGVDLAELDRRRRSALGRGLPLWFVCAVVDVVAEGLESAHQSGVLHRDVKPSNIFGSPQTGMRLGDFGIATALRKPAERSGTVRFVAPEALREEMPSRGWDVYSLGATAYDLYYGHPPFLDLAQVLGGAPASFPAARRAEEAYFQHVLGRMLDRDPSRRFATVKPARRLLAPLGRSLRPPLQGVPLSRGEFQLGPVRVRCRLGDIAMAEADGVVNSAKDNMRMRNGVGAALRVCGGDVIEEEALQTGRHAIGEVISTGAGTLKFKRVLHAVSGWKEVSCIGRATQRALLVAEELGLRSLAFPSLGTGMAQVAREASAFATASALYWHVLLGGTRLREIEFVLYDKETLQIYIDELGNVLTGDDAEPEEDVVPTRDDALDETLELTSLTRTVP